MANFSNLKIAAFTFVAITLTCLLTLAGLELMLRLNNVSHITPGYLKTNPVRRYELRPNFKGKTYEMPFLVNSNSLRDYDREISQGNDTYRVAVYGDSLTMGIGVKMEETFPKILENKLNQRSEIPIQVFNFGVNGYNTVMQKNYLFESYEKYKPHMAIIVLAVGNSAALTTSGSIKNANQYYLIRMIKDQLRYLHSYHWLSAKYHNLILELKNRTVISGNKEKKVLGKEPLGDPLLLYRDNLQGWVDAQQAYKDISAFCHKNNITLVFAIYGSTKLFSKIPKKDFYYPATKKIMNSLSIAKIEHQIFLDDVFRNYYNNKSILWIKPKDYHLSKFAHELVGNKLFNYFIEENFIEFS